MRTIPSGAESSLSCLSRSRRTAYGNLSAIRPPHRCSTGVASRCHSSFRYCRRFPAGSLLRIPRLADVFLQLPHGGLQTLHRDDRLAGDLDVVVDDLLDLALPFLLGLPELADQPLDLRSIVLRNRQTLKENVDAKSLAASYNAVNLRRVQRRDRSQKMSIASRQKKSNPALPPSMRRAVIYCRVSNLDEEKKGSLNSRVRGCRARREARFPGRPGRRFRGTLHRRRVV